MDVLREDAASRYSLSVLNQPSGRAEADRFQKLVWDFALSKSRAGWMKVLLTDGRVAGHVVDLAQMPNELGKMKVCGAAGCATRKLATRTTVVGVLWRMLVDPVGVQFLDPPGHAAVQIAPAGVQDRLIGHIARQGVAEQVGQVALDLLGQDQLGVAQPAQLILQPIAAGDDAR